MIKVSVIIPVYNSENYLDDCLISVLNQSLREIEIIVINDGSTDNSLNIIKRYANSDSRIIIIEQNNYGGGIARNKGILLAQGEYIGFVDADDWVDNNYYERLYYTVKQNKADLARALQLRYFPDGVTETDYNEIIKNRFQNNELLKKNDHSMSALTALYKRDLIIKNKIFFDVTRSSHDKLFTVKAMYFAEKILPVVDTFYHHRDNVPGQLTTFDSNRLKNATCADKNVIKFINSVNYNNINDYITTFERLLYETRMYFNFAVSEQTISKNDMKTFFSGMVYIYKHCKYKNMLFQGVDEPFFFVLKKKSFNHYYSFCTSHNIMTLRIFFGKARRKILHMLLGKNLYTNYELISHQEKLTNELINRINNIENQLSEQNRFIGEQRELIDRLLQYATSNTKGYD